MSYPAWVEGLVNMISLYVITNKVELVCFKQKGTILILIGKPYKNSRPIYVPRQ